MRIRVDDVTLFFDVEGSKLRPNGPAMREVPTLLLLHGGPGFDHSGFKPAFAEMAKVAQVVYLDLRGNGRSDAGPPNKWSLEQWAEEVHSFCEGSMSHRRTPILRCPSPLFPLPTPCSAVFCPTVRPLCAKPT